MIVALTHDREPFHLVHDLIHQILQPLRKVAVGFLALDRFELHRQFQHELLGVRVVTHAVLHSVYQLQHRLPCLAHQLISGLRLLFVEMEHLVAEDIIGELGLDLTDAFLGQIGLARFCGPGHHMDVRMLALVVEGRIPAEVTGRDLHCRRDVVAVGADEVSPCGGVVATQTGSILTLEGDDVRPHVSAVALQLRHGFLQRNGVVITEQAVGADALSTRSGGDVLHVLV